MRQLADEPTIAATIYKIIARNFSIQLLCKFSSLFLSLWVTQILSRYLGIRGYGMFTISVTYFSLWGVLADLGTQTLMVRELSSLGRMKKRTFGTFFIIKTFLVIVSMFLAAISLIFLPYDNELKKVILVASLGVFVGLLNNSGIAALCAKLRSDLVSVSELIGRLFTIISIIIFIYFHLGLYAIVLSILIGNLAASFFINFSLVRYVIKTKISFSLKIAKAIMRKSIPIGIVSILISTYFKLDTMILSFYKLADEVGKYALSYKIIENILAIWGLFMASVFPIMSSLRRKNDLHSMMKLKKISYLAVIVFSFLALPVFYMYSPNIILFLGGEEYGGSVILLRILLLSLPLFFINNISYYLLLINGEIKKIAMVYSMALIANLALNMIFIPRYGSLATSINTVLSEAIISVSFIFLRENKIENVA